MEEINVFNVVKDVEIANHHLTVDLVILAHIFILVLVEKLALLDHMSMKILFVLFAIQAVELVLVHLQIVKPVPMG